VSRLFSTLYIYDITIYHYICRMGFRASESRSSENPDLQSKTPVNLEDLEKREAGDTRAKRSSYWGLL